MSNGDSNNENPQRPKRRRLQKLTLTEAGNQLGEKQGKKDKESKKAIQKEKNSWRNQIGEIFSLENIKKQLQELIKSILNLINREENEPAHEPYLEELIKEIFPIIDKELESQKRLTQGTLEISEGIEENLREDLINAYTLIKNSIEKLKPLTSTISFIKNYEPGDPYVEKVSEQGANLLEEISNLLKEKIVDEKKKNLIRDNTQKIITEKETNPFYIESNEILLKSLKDDEEALERLKSRVLAKMRSEINGHEITDKTLLDVEEELKKAGAHRAIAKNLNEDTKINKKNRLTNLVVSTVELELAMALFAKKLQEETSAIVPGSTNEHQVYLETAMRLIEIERLLYKILAVKKATQKEK